MGETERQWLQNFISIAWRKKPEDPDADRAIPKRIKPYGVTTGLMWFRIRSRGKAFLKSVTKFRILYRTKNFLTR